MGINDLKSILTNRGSNTTSNVNANKNQKMPEHINDFKIRKNLLKSLSITGGVQNLGNVTNIRNGPFIGRSFYFELIKKIGSVQ